MPKQVFENGRLTIELDPADPEDIQEMCKRQLVGKLTLKKNALLVLYKTLKKLGIIRR